jgi:hypothetical protein
MGGIPLKKYKTRFDRCLTLLFLAAKQDLFIIKHYFDHGTVVCLFLTLGVGLLAYETRIACSRKTPTN